MIKDGGLSFETQLKIGFLSPNNGSKKCWEKSLLSILTNFKCCQMRGKSKSCEFGQLLVMEKGK